MALTGRDGSKRRISPGTTCLEAFERRVRSWLRMNAGGAPNTCKSNGTHLRVEASGERLSNTWRTCPLPRDSRPKGRVIPDTPGRRMAPGLKPRREGMAPRPIR